MVILSQSLWTWKKKMSDNRFSAKSEACEMVNQAGLLTEYLEEGNDRQAVLLALKIAGKAQKVAHLILKENS
jgi:hypothetical protein